MTRPADAETVRSDEAPPNGREIRARMQKACAIAHGRGGGMSANELLELIYEEGLPPRQERGRILQDKLAQGDNTDLGS